jgi:hypothetical protein
VIRWQSFYAPDKASLERLRGSPMYNDRPKVPATCLKLWQAFWSLRNTAQISQTGLPLKIQFSEMLAYSKIMGFKNHELFSKVISELDSVYIDERAERLRRRSNG